MRQKLLQNKLNQAGYIIMQESPAEQHWIDPLFNDLYQFTCSFTYFQSRKHDAHATFEVFFRKHPFAGQYALFAGLEAVRQFVHSFRITPQHRQFLHKVLPHLTNDYLDWLQQDFSGKVEVKAIRQGSVVFAREPLISYSGPLGFVQLLQTPVLNLLGFATLVASNASRMAKAVHPKKCIQFGIRRAQGPDGGLSASAYAFLGGFAGTSNVKAAQIHDIPCLGTMSHAFITSFAGLHEVEEFEIGGVNIKQRALAIRQERGLSHSNEGELAAFLSYARTFPNNFKTLIDTYDTLGSGMLNTIAVALALEEAGITGFGIRLDSGDLCQLSKDCRSLWLKHLPNTPFTIFASDDLHEERLLEMEAQGSQIDVYAIGTHIATCKKQPALGLVCKLTSLDGTPRMKFSADPDKATLPGDKAVFRGWEGPGAAAFDLIALEGEEVGLGENCFYSLAKEEATIRQVTKIQRLNGILDCHGVSQSLLQSKAHMETSVQELPESIFALTAPTKHPILLTQKFLDTLRAVRLAIAPRGPPDS